MILRLALVLLAAVLGGCLALSTPGSRPAVVTDAPVATATPAAAETPAATATPAAPHASAATAAPVVTATSAVSASPLPDLSCGPHPLTRAMVAEVQPEPWLEWVRQLSGAEPVLLDGEQVTIRTRYTPAMFGEDGEGGLPHARAFDYVEQTVRDWYPAEQIAVQPFRATSRSGEILFGKNLILTIPGERLAGEVVILSAHLDSTSGDDPLQTAPGAEDNASGSAALLEAARLFREMRFERTLRIIWFTGEEQGLVGSRAYVQKLEDPDTVLGVINLDMFGYDSDGDGCFELHVGTLPESDRVGRCFVASAAAYEPELEQYDYLTGEEAIGGSDHGPFWARGIGAIEVLENMFDNQHPNGCPNADSNPSYHSPEDTHDKLNTDSAIRIVRAALASAAAMAGPLQ